MGSTGQQDVGDADDALAGAGGGDRSAGSSWQAGGETVERARLVSQRARERGRGCALRAERGERGVRWASGPSWAGQERRKEGAHWAEHHGSSADRAEEKGGERSGPREEGVWAGQKRGLGREIEFWAGLGFLFPILSSFLFAISNTTQSKNHLNSNSNLNSNLALKQKNNAPA